MLMPLDLKCLWCLLGFVHSCSVLLPVPRVVVLEAVKSLINILCPILIEAIAVYVCVLGQVKPLYKN
jgi:hypothetical protein